MPCIIFEIKHALPLINNLSGTLDFCGVLIFKYAIFCCLIIALISDDELLCNSVKSSTRNGPICLICKVTRPFYFPHFPYPYVTPLFWIICISPRVELLALISFDARIPIVLSASTHSVKILHCRILQEPLNAICAK